MSDGSSSGSGDWWSIFGKGLDYLASRDASRSAQEHELELQRLRNAANASGQSAGGFPLSLPSWLTAPSAPAGAGNSGVVASSVGSLNLSGVLVPIVLLVVGGIALKAFKVI